MNAFSILIVEDDETLGQQISKLLQAKGFITELCYDGEQGLLTALKKSFDLVLLDVMLPRMDGLKVLNLLRQERQTPVMMLTALGAEEDRIKGLSIGADDYLPKPFNFTEMSLRVDALLRRSNQINNQENPLQLQNGKLKLNRLEQSVHYQDQLIELSPIQFRMLWMLVENQGEVLSKSYLSLVALGKAFSRYDRSLDMHLSRIRKKLISAGMQTESLRTIHGKGYSYR
ncbi:response regulator transcription factor [Marinomonas foliarum]|jgi:two-component system, OmpR family, response regulator PfeR|uniref:Response regulator transcription factor n=1 Tax=Marinomonas foliarum TaxID=491950 RepID=A0ABX7IN77_9GAMM|nr:response regulator transcription factor [Marinomonas foliarum]QRV23791.1 response regulator transcription factor [Marinomonas foliarum]